MYALRRRQGIGSGEAENAERRNLQLESSRVYQCTLQFGMWEWQTAQTANSTPGAKAQAAGI
jgi:hypothetical protein